MRRFWIATLFLLTACTGPGLALQPPPTPQSEPTTSAQASTAALPTITPVPTATQAPTVTPVQTEVPITPTTLATEATTANDDWMFRPDIVAIRDIYNEVEQGIKASTLRKDERTAEYCEPGGDTRRVMATDANGIVRFYQHEAGSEDSSLTWSHYYDNQGRLRFVFITGGAVNGAQLEHRIYFDENQQRMVEKQKYATGVEYSFPQTWPADELQLTDPESAFAADMPDCN